MDLAMRTTWSGAVLVAIALVVAVLIVRFLYFLTAGSLALRSRVDQEIALRREKALFGQAMKQAFAAALEPVVRAVEASGVHPHTLTLLCVLLSGLAAMRLGLGDVTGGGLLAAVASIFDYLDGKIARRSGRASLAGNFLDSTGDRIAELALFGGVAVLFRQSALLLTLTLIASGTAILISYARAKAESLTLELKSGWLQRPERMTILCASATLDPLAHRFAGPSALGPHPLLALAICVLALLGVVTTVQRLLAGTRAAASREGAKTPR